MTHTQLTRKLLLAVVLLTLAASAALATEPKLVAQSGKGALYELNGHRIAILAGTPEEMGRQHGTLLKQDIRELVQTVLQFCKGADNLKKKDYFAGTLEKAYDRCEKFIPKRYLAEIDALADAAGIPRKDARTANIFPELFHCSGFALMGHATLGGELFHGRVLDYMTDFGFQATAVTFICLPAGRHPFVNVGYAGFIGSVTGMNAEKIAFGEMGGRGEGNWDGMPMTFLVRKGMEEAATLDQALRIFRETPRTCEYYYVISDGKTRRAAGLKCTPTIFDVVLPGKPHPQLSKPIADTVILSAGKRYDLLVQRVKQNYGHIDAQAAIALMQRPVAMKGNLHNALFAPERLGLWVAHAADPIKVPDYQACNQPYTYIDFRKFLKLARTHAVHAAPVAKTREITIPTAPPSLHGTAHDNARPEITPAADPHIAALLQPYILPQREFQWQATLKANALNFAIYQLQFPSPVKTSFPQNNTVHGEYFRCHGTGKRPAVVVLHILDGRFLVARLVCTTLANAGIDALMIKLPFYGERRPPDIKAPMKDPKLFQLLIRQGVADTRRAAALMAHLDRTPDQRIGVCGVSLGGFVAALTAGVDGHFHRAAFILAGGGLYDVITSGSRETRTLNQNFAQAGIVADKLKTYLAPIDPVTFAARIKNCDAILLNVTGDEVVPAASAKALAKAAGDKPIIWYKGDKHTDMLRHILDTLNRTKAHFQK